MQRELKKLTDHLQRVAIVWRDWKKRKRTGQLVLEMRFADSKLGHRTITERNVDVLRLPPIEKPPTPMKELEHARTALFDRFGTQPAYGVVQVIFRLCDGVVVDITSEIAQHSR